ncbi:hypothetical protein [Aeromonas allosaccharophila]|uniref:hypothetical protein n=1 Tax=Aeromonas TaxID=642 RepID=UPI0036DCEDE9
MRLNIERDKVILVEKNKRDFDKELKKQNVKISHFTNAGLLDYHRFKFLLIKQSGSYLGYVVLAETINKINNIKTWILANIEICPQIRGKGIGSVTLAKVHDIFTAELKVRSYIVTLNSYVMYKMIVRENLKGNVDFYCLINPKYPVDEMKKEEVNLEQAFIQNPSVHADMIVSFDKEETERLKPIYFKVS